VKGKSKNKTHSAIRSILGCIGENPRREGLLDTPRRVDKANGEIYAGYSQSAQDVLGRTFCGDGYDQLILLRDIEFYSTCEHHMLPFSGLAHVGYIPGQSDRVVGLSKIARVVDVFAKRLQIQERMTEEIANAIEQAVKPLGIAVIVEGKHHCVAARGVKKARAVMVTSAMRGVFRTNPGARAEFISLAGVGKVQ
jgi:GTP cyclohydrolase I